METKSNREWMVKVRDKCGFKNWLIVSSVGSSGGLALFWKDDITIHVQKYSMSHIDAFVDGGEGVGWWWLTGFYGNLDTAKRHESWSLLRSIKDMSQLPWIAIGDFKDGNFCPTRGYLARPDPNGPDFTWSDKE